MVPANPNISIMSLKFFNIPFQDCAILVYSKDNPQSILNLVHWRSEFMKHAGNAPLLIACNKSELSDSISDQAIDMADQNGYQVNLILD